MFDGATLYFFVEAIDFILSTYDLCLETWSFMIRSSVLLWYQRASRTVTVPGNTGGLLHTSTSWGPLPISLGSLLPGCLALPAILVSEVSQAASN